METTIVYQRYTGIREKNMETTIGFRADAQEVFTPEAFRCECTSASTSHKAVIYAALMSDYIAHCKKCLKVGLPILINTARLT